MEQNNAKELTPWTRADLMALTSYTVPVTYNDLADDRPPLNVVFKCKIALTADDVNARQAFYGQPAGDIAAGQHAYNVDFLARIVTDVEGLPEFEPTPTLAEALKGYLSPEAPIFLEIAQKALDRYTIVSQPAEFFR
jgi:hypothetical protein